MLHEYSVWLRSQTKSGHRITFQNCESAFRDHIANVWQHPKPNYIEPMIKYYDDLK